MKKSWQLFILLPTFLFGSFFLLWEKKNYFYNTKQFRLGIKEGMHHEKDVAPIYRKVLRQGRLQPEPRRLRAPYDHGVP